MSKLHNVPVKTLRYYDEIGLLKPIEVDPFTRYRYYSTEQFEHLDMINYLKNLGISLKDIQFHLRKRDVHYFLQLLRRGQEETDTKMKELQLIRDRFANRIKELEATLTITQTGVVMLKEIPERTILSLKEKMSTEPELELSVRKLEKMSYDRIPVFIGKVGFTVSEDNLRQRKFDEYDSVFLLLEENTDSTKPTQTLAAGRYACIYYRGSHSESREYYKILLSHIEEHNYVIVGEALERTIVDQFIAQDRNNHLTEIQIPVQVRNS